MSIFLLWELDNKPVEDTRFGEACNVDLRKINAEDMADDHWKPIDQVF